MIKIGSLLNVIDNSGVKIVKCLKIKNNSNKKYATIGDLIYVVITELRYNLCNKKKAINFKKKDMLTAVIVLVKKFYDKKSGIKYYFNKNCVVLLNNNFDLLSHRIVNPINKIVNKKSKKFVNLFLKK